MARYGRRHQIAPGLWSAPVMTNNNEESAVSNTANPYDRRDRRGASDGAFYAEGRMAVVRSRGLAIEDLEAMAASAHERGHEEATERLAERHGVALVDARRRAWDEGHATGEAAGRQALLREIGEQWEGRVEVARQKLGDALTMKPEGEMKAEALSVLLMAAQSAHQLLGDLQDAHHDGFRPELPF